MTIKRLIVLIQTALEDEKPVPDTSGFYRGRASAFRYILSLLGKD